MYSCFFLRIFHAGLANEAMDARRSWFTTSTDDHVEQHTLIPWNEKEKSSAAVTNKVGGGGGGGR
jgi:hypothetical protein